ncbi:MAG: hypothetical protein ACE5HR_04955, partial [bacterium]
ILSSVFVGQIIFYRFMRDLHFSIVNQVKKARISSFTSPDRIYEKLSSCILAEFKASPRGKPVKKIDSLTEDQKNILRSLRCEHLATRKYVKRFSSLELRRWRARSKPDETFH